MQECHTDELHNLLAYEKIHANVAFLIGSLLYMPVSIWDVIVENRRHDQYQSLVTAQQLLLDDDEVAANLLYMDDAFIEFENQVEEEHWLYLLTLCLATLAYLVNGLMETKMAYDEYYREIERLEKLTVNGTKEVLLELPPTTLNDTNDYDELLLQQQQQQQQDEGKQQQPHSDASERISPRFKHEIINGFLFCIAATLEFAFSIIGRSTFLLSLSAHCYVANAMLTIWLRQQDKFNPRDPTVYFVHGGDWLFLLGACLDTSGTWLEMSGYLKEPAKLWLMSSIAWLTDSLLYLAADAMNLRDDETENIDHYKCYDDGNNNAPGNDNPPPQQQTDVDDGNSRVAVVFNQHNDHSNDKIGLNSPIHSVIDRSDYDPELTTPYTTANDGLI